MPLLTQSQPDNEQDVLVASMDNARNLSNILKAITFKDHAIFTATPNGLKVTVEDSKCLQANAFIQVCLLYLYPIMLYFLEDYGEILHIGYYCCSVQ